MKQISRREFLAAGMTGAALLCFPGPSAGFDLWGTKTRRASGPSDITGSVFKNSAPETPWKWSVEAFDYVKHADRSVTCAICPHECRLLPGDRGLCRSRVNIDGVLYSLVYGNPCSINVDPVEKKPLFHFLPRTTAFSIAGAGCNFRCLNCQNWEISQATPETLRHYELFPDGVVQSAGQAGAASIAYTYSEAVTFFEYMYDTARLARQQGIKSLLISNGYISKNPLSALCDVIDGANINLKSFDDALYRKLNGGRLAPVLDTLETLHRRGVHLEVTHLVVPGYTDEESLFRRMCAWIVEALGPDHPLHLLRFFPQYRLNRLAPTPVEVLTRFRNLAMAAGIRYVYVGNVPDHEGVHTRCPNCNRVLIFRHGYNVTQPGIKNGRCAACGTAIPGVWV
ncbi:AmmeMemoRadiSam system radical SAM enzyme [Desulfosudis oleivorans]|uniref:Radical SAM domain protein n=1 Tax=Desulfosudis oleivorans (strain DSM 6200 / JCM 39069 / Hxd3) TaxID=96561 RepID=A8ZVP8_DESOH|nr:AmmeMemoRadiSam system radical SAM enzyme [Desulfosudis oleivorans]ABW68235.1 Radical SAM domain protein [Desulfosudis oleivorans Hxd3]